MSTPEPGALLAALQAHAAASNVEPRPRVDASDTTTYLQGEFDLDDILKRLAVDPVAYAVFHSRERNESTR